MNDLNTPTFDPDAFMQATIDSPLSTEYQLIPEGDYQAMIDNFDRDAFEVISFTYQKGARAGTPGTMNKFNCPFVLNNEAVRTSLGRDRLLATAQLILDFVPGTQQLDFGKDRNVKLGQLRQAVGQNVPGPWSPATLRGAGPLMIQVKHVSFKRSDGTEGKRAEVVRFAPIR